MPKRRHSEEEVAVPPGAALGVCGAGQGERVCEQRDVVVSARGAAAVVRHDWPTDREGKAWLMQREMQRIVNVRDYLQWFCRINGDVKVLPKIRGRLQRTNRASGGSWRR